MLLPCYLVSVSFIGLLKVSESSFKHLILYEVFLETHVFIFELMKYLISFRDINFEGLYVYTWSYQSGAVKWTDSFFRLPLGKGLLFKLPFEFIFFLLMTKLYSHMHSLVKSSLSPPRITGSRVRILLKARFFPNLNGASLHRAFHVHPSIVSKWLKYCWRDVKP